MMNDVEPQGRRPQGEQLALRCYLGVTLEFVVDYKYGYKIYKNYFIIFVNSKKLVFLVFLKLCFLSFLCYEMQKADFEE